jgi:methionyl-tRNA synthetase
MDQALEILPSDYWRWWLLSHAPETSDSEFTWEAFQQDVNKDLADVLGNFVSRITKFCRSKFGEVVPEGGDYGPQETALIAELLDAAGPLPGPYGRHRGAQGRRRIARDLGRGQRVPAIRRPWTAFKEDPDRAAAITRFALNLIPFYAGLSAPFIPDAAAAMAEAMGAELTWPDSAEAALSALPPGHAFTVPEVLFAKIADEDREGWAERFAGIRT